MIDTDFVLTNEVLQTNRGEVPNEGDLVLQRFVGFRSGHAKIEVRKFKGGRVLPYLPGHEEDTL